VTICVSAGIAVVLSAWLFSLLAALTGFAPGLGPAFGWTIYLKI